MRKLSVLLVTGMLMAGFGASMAAELAPGAAVDHRQAEMKKLGATMKAVSAFAKGEGTVEDARAAYAAANGVPPNLVALFVPGTAMGDPGAEKSEALPAIWEKPDVFKTASDDMIPVWAALGQALEAGDAAAAGAALGNVGGTCKACHLAFRKPQ